MGPLSTPHLLGRQEGEAGCMGKAWQGRGQARWGPAFLTFSPGSPVPHMSSARDGLIRSLGGLGKAQPGRACVCMAMGPCGRECGHILEFDLLFCWFGSWLCCHHAWAWKSSLHMGKGTVSSLLWAGCGPRGQGRGLKCRCPRMARFEIINSE